jgi:hypothetical protein
MGKGREAHVKIVLRFRSFFNSDSNIGEELFLSTESNTRFVWLSNHIVFLLKSAGNLPRICAQSSSVRLCDAIANPFHPVAHLVTTLITKCATDVA